MVCVSRQATDATRGYRHRGGVARVEQDEQTPLIVIDEDGGLERPEDCFSPPCVRAEKGSVE